MRESGEGTRYLRVDHEALGQDPASNEEIAREVCLGSCSPSKMRLMRVGRRLGGASLSSEAAPAPREANSVRQRRIYRDQLKGRRGAWLREQRARALDDSAERAAERARVKAA